MRNVVDSFVTFNRDFQMIMKMKYFLLFMRNLVDSFVFWLIEDCCPLSPSVALFDRLLLVSFEFIPQNKGEK